MRALFEYRVIPEALVKEMLTAWPMKSVLPNHRYGLGVQRFDSEFGPASGHSGQFVGYRSRAFYFENSGIAVSIQVNADVESDELLPTFMTLVRYAHENGSSL